MERQNFVMFAEAVLLLLMTICTGMTAAVSVDGQYSFVVNSSNSPVQAEYDYIIVGGGTAGCPLAATLSEKYKVILLERGGAPFEKPNVVSINNFARVLADIDDATISPAQGFQSLDGIYNRRARVLGGGSAINAGFFSRANPEWINNRHMKWNRVNASFEWVEAVVASFPNMGTWQTTVFNGLLEVGVGPNNGYTYDHIVGVKVGGSIFDRTGHRRTAADLLQYANADNIFVYLYANVHQILFNFDPATGNPKAAGVLYTDEHGRAHTALLSNTVGSEVIITAGALGSPQLLMLSGIGPADHLNEFDIPVVLDQPGVGSGMCDNPTLTMMVPSRLPLEQSLISTVGIMAGGFYIEAASGPNEALGEVVALNTLDPEYRTFDLLRTFASMVPNFPQDALQDIANAGVLLGKIADPVSTGYLRLNTTDVRHNPIVKFNYFEDPADIYACIEGVRVMVELTRSRAMSNLTYPLPESVKTWAGYVAPLAPDTTEAALLGQWCRQTVLTIWHFHGGNYRDVVVDHTYRVIGVDALRIIDGSTFNSSPGTNPQATVMMLGRYMGLEILDERATSA
ncbi:hypothetical protein R1flu_022970 [Riccia fluitans]|uniref:Glucose-methanol-choline oxidoreductase N-terminal domain-containing protein n=1 Tax=Riccia fluitans TaxID=41844 RepID=A0ABD1XUS4_9MARC